MIRQICSIKLEDVAKVRSSELLAKLELQDLYLIFRERRLRWFGHVERSSGADRTACDIRIDGRQGARRPKLTWKKLTEKDCREWKLKTVDSQKKEHLEIRFEIGYSCIKVIKIRLSISNKYNDFGFISFQIKGALSWYGKLTFESAHAWNLILCLLIVWGTTFIFMVHLSFYAIPLLIKFMTSCMISLQYLRVSSYNHF